MNIVHKLNNDVFTSDYSNVPIIMRLRIALAILIFGIVAFKGEHKVLTESEG